MIKKILPLVGALMLAGCVNLAPEYERPEAPVAQAWPTGEAYEAAQLKAEQLPSWNEFFVNESLREVIRLGLENNRSLLAVAHTVEQMRAQYRVQRSELFPTVAAAAQNAVTNTSRMTQAQGLDITSHNYTAQLAMASYEIDFFGRIRNLNEQALQAYLASEDAHRSARSTLIAEIAMMWLQLGADRMQLALQQETLKSQEESFRLIEESYQIGSVSRLDYEQARSTVATARLDRELRSRRRAGPQRARTPRRHQDRRLAPARAARHRRDARADPAAGTSRGGAPQSSGHSAGRA